MRHGHGSVQGEARSRSGERGARPCRLRRARSACSPPGCGMRRSGSTTASASSTSRSTEAADPEPAGGRGGVPARSRRTSATGCDEAPVVTELAEIGSFRLADAVDTPSSIWSCTPATCRARACSTRGSCAGGRSGSMPGAARTWRSSWAAASAAASSSARPGARCGSRTSRSTRSTQFTDRAGSSAPRCCSSRAKARRAGAASSRRPRAGRSRSGSRRHRSAIGWWSDELRSRTSTHVTERELLDAARRGDEDAYGRLVAPPRAAPRPLLPDARLGPRRRGRAAGRTAPRLARPRPVRRPQLAPVVALHDRDQRLSEGDRTAAQARASDRLRPGGRSARRPGASRSSSRCGSSRIPTSGSASRTASPYPRPATSSARASSSPSSRRSSTCRRASAPC